MSRLVVAGTMSHLLCRLADLLTKFWPHFYFVSVGSAARRSNATLAVFNNKLDMTVPNYHGSQDTLWEDWKIDKVSACTA
jgi:hypothetical protein